MKKILLVFAILFMCLGLASLLSGQDMLSELKVIYGYNNWPGKTGEIKQEPNLNLLNLPGFILISKTTGEDGTTYKWGETQDKAQIAATVKFYSTIEDAQMGLLNILSQYSMILANTENYSFKAGDIGFAVNENDAIIFVAFVRNNITVVIKNVDFENPVSVKDIAVQIDSVI